MPRLRRPRSPVHLLRQVVAGLLVCLALVLALRPPPPAAGSAPTTVPVVVAAADLAAGAALTAADLAVALVPADSAPAGVVTDVPQLTGAVLASPLRAGEPVTDVRVVGPGLWAAVPTGQVAAPVRLADLAVATLLRAGDRVDVLAAGDTAPVPADPVPTGSEQADGAKAGSTPAHTVQVVAAGALVLAAPTPAPEDDDGTDGLLVLAVSPDTAGRLAAAAASATLTVTLGAP
ncbi:Flp pilus assembly protein CpaB [Modestobacter sp. L9-4]|uniref:Flp pilus assembly protein CpaB n=1 Tax=Modestobacter sp. L9-4 TaxID=2851567 RepID=UPI001C7410C9|nr:Flp pilus assembly protein CpaB [Modestobacter sp. L9-4]QXG74943.1 Flp pilus assembly protein CpaB [Modestobacter sp. L9-4]